jgi:hypothetical protein
MSVVAAAIIGTAAVSAYSSNQAAKKAQQASNRQADVGDASVQLGRDQFDWFKTEYERQAPEREKQTQLANRVSESQIAGMDFATDEAKRLAERNRTVFQPVEDRIVADAQTFDTPCRRMQASAEAAADVEAAFGRAQQANQRTMLRMGVTPGGSASAALMQDAALEKAKAVAGASTTAVRNVEQQGYARMQDAAALGKGMIGNQATQQQIASNTGGQAVNSGQAALAANASGAGLMQTGFQGAMSGLNQGAQLYGQAGRWNEVAAGHKKDGLMELSSAAGYFMGSDKNTKSDTGNVTDGKAELAEVNATPVETNWQYDPAKGGPNEGGKRRTGPMAQSVRRTMGEKTAPGGRVIDLREMGGKLMASVQALSAQVEGLERRVGRMSHQGAAA